MKEHPIAQIPLTQGKVAIIDQNLLGELSNYCWYYNNGYAFARMLRGDVARPVAMHAYIMKTPKGFHTHHINHNTLDNRIINLEVCTPQKNIRDRRSYKAEQNPFYGKKHSEELKQKTSQRCSIPVVQISLDGVCVSKYPSALDAERMTGISNGNISSVILGRRNTAGGFIWKRA